MSRAGKEEPKTNAGKIGGWKTRSVFERYNIVDRDIGEALHKLEQSQAQEFGHKVGHNPPENDSAPNPSKTTRLN